MCDADTAARRRGRLMVALKVPPPPAVASVGVELAYVMGDARITARFTHGHTSIKGPLPNTMDLRTAKTLRGLLNAAIATAEGDPADLTGSHKP